MQHLRWQWTRAPLLYRESNMYGTNPCLACHNEMLVYSVLVTLLACTQSVDILFHPFYSTERMTAFLNPVCSGLDIKQFGPLAQGASRFEKSLAQGPVDFASHWPTNSRHRQHAYSLRQNRSHGKSCNSVHCLL